jgi:hypothetical protein
MCAAPIPAIALRSVRSHHSDGRVVGCRDASAHAIGAITHAPSVASADAVEYEVRAAPVSGKTPT